MATILAPPPLETPLVEPPAPNKPPTWLMTRAWFNWFLAVVNRVQTAAVAVVSIALTAQTASIAPTALLPVAASGRYRVTIHARVTTAAGTSSSLTPTVHYTAGAVSCTQVGAAMTSNATNQPASWTFLVKADAGSPISYSTTYASSGAPAMAYAFDVLVESLG